MEEDNGVTRPGYIMVFNCPVCGIEIEREELPLSTTVVYLKKREEEGWTANTVTVDKRER